MTMPYITFTEVVERMDGIERLRAYLGGHPEDLQAVADDDDHPYFDHILTGVQKEIDSVLNRAGYVTPVAGGITDPNLRNATAALMIHRITQTSSSRESWIADYVADWRAYLKRVAEGEEAVSGLTAADDLADLALASSVNTEVPQFNTGEPYAQIDDVFVSLGAPRTRW